MDTKMGHLVNNNFVKRLYFNAHPSTKSGYQEEKLSLHLGTKFS